MSGRTTGSPAGETVRLLLNNDLKLTVPVADGRFAGTFDTGPLPDGPYTIYADVPDDNGGQFSNGTNVYVDEDPDDIAVTSPAPGSTITSFGSEGLVITGRVARPDLVDRVPPIISERSLRGVFASVAEDGTFRMAVEGQDVPQGTVRIAVVPWDCLTSRLSLGLPAGDQPGSERRGQRDHRRPAAGRHADADAAHSHPEP